MTELKLVKSISTGTKKEVDPEPCEHCGWTHEPSTMGKYRCDRCGHVSISRDPCDTETNQEVQCSKCHGIETSRIGDA